jgi:GT2 family glycosyltransferase
MKNKSQISVIIVNHNSKTFLQICLSSLLMQTDVILQLIIVDNHSTDGAKDYITSKFPSVLWLSRPTSVGFAAANNLGLHYVLYDTILFLNPDTKLNLPTTLSQCYQELWDNNQIGTLTPRVNLALTGEIDVTCHRGFPTPWRGFCHFFGLEKLFPRSHLTTGYTLKTLGYETAHPVDVIGGMFMLVRKNVGDRVGWWDEDFSLYGEDIDFCYRLYLLGYQSYYYPAVSILHYKGVTTGMSKQSKSVSTASTVTTKQVKLWSMSAMEIFYQKHYASRYPFFFNWFVKLGIKIIKIYRMH